MKRDAIIYCLVQGIGAALIMWLCLTLVGCNVAKAYFIIQTGGIL